MLRLVADVTDLALPLSKNVGLPRKLPSVKDEPMRRSAPRCLVLNGTQTMAGLKSGRIFRFDSLRFDGFLSG